MAGPMSKQLQGHFSTSYHQCHLYAYLPVFADRRKMTVLIFTKISASSMKTFSKHLRGKLYFTDQAISVVNICSLVSLVSFFKFRVPAFPEADSK